MGPSGEERDGRLKSAPLKELPSRAVNWGYDSLSWLVVFFLLWLSWGNMKRERTRGSLINRFGVSDGQETCIDGNIPLIFCGRQRPAILKGSEYSTV